MSQSSEEFQTAQHGGDLDSASQEDCYCKVSVSTSRKDVTSQDLTHRSQPDPEDQCQDLAIAREGEVGALANKITELSDDVVERIIARLPFPTLLEAKRLSRAWYSKFSHPSSSMRSLSLQAQISSISSRWPIFHPTYICRDGLLGFDKSSNQWQFMPVLSYLPILPHWSIVACRGPLICGISNPQKRIEVFTTNVITRYWKKLPNIPHFSEEIEKCLAYKPHHVAIMFSNTSSYEVLLSYVGARGTHILLYDSNIGMWSLNDSGGADLSLTFDDISFHDGKLHFMCDSDAGNSFQQWVYDVAEHSYSAVPGWNDEFPLSDVLCGATLFCGDKIIMAFWIETIDPDRAGVSLSLPSIERNSIIIYKLAPGSLLKEHVATGPPVIFEERSLSGRSSFTRLAENAMGVTFTSDEHFLYFGRSKPSCGTLTFNVHNHEWTCLPPAPSMNEAYEGDITDAFEPGLNPFVEV